jgi:hypothetical protein
LVSRFAPTQWNGTKTVSGPDRGDPGRRLHLAAAGRDHVTGSPSTTPIRSASIGCSSTNGPSSGSSLSADPAGLGAGLVLREHPAGRQVQRVLASAGSAGPRCSTATNRARPSGVANRSANSRGVPGWSAVRARPEDALLLADPVVGDAE